MKKLLTSVLLSVFMLIGFTMSTQAQVSFTMDTTWGCNMLTVTFTNTSSGSALGYWMDFGDGEDTSYLGKPTVQHTYYGSGEMDVVLAGFDAQQQLVGTDFQQLNMYGIQFADTPIDTACPGEEFWIQVDGHGNDLIVDWGDGSMDTTQVDGREVHHTYANAGSYHIVAGISSVCGFDTMGIDIVADSAAPAISEFGIDPWMACPGETFQFWASMGETESYQFEWDFGNGDTSNHPFPKQMYPDTGFYQVTLTATNGCGNTSTDTQNAVVSDTVGISDWLDLYGHPPIVCPGDPMQFGVDGTPDGYKYWWNFGDGSPIDSSGGRVSHSYALLGQYTVTVMLENMCGARDTLDQQIGVDTGLQAMLDDESFGSTIEDGSCPGDSAIFWYGGTVGGGSLNWDFGDGNNGMATDTLTVEDGFVVTIIKHAYAAVGTYTATLTYTNGCGNSTMDSIEVEITNNASAHAEFLVDAPSHGAEYLPCESIGFLGLGGISYFWEFGDGDTMTSTADKVSHSFDAPGLYTVELTATNGCGNSDTYDEQIEIGDLPEVGVAVVSSNTAEATYSRGAVSFQWYRDGNIIAGQTASTITAGTDGAYTATAMDSLGCESTSTDTVDLVANSVFTMGMNQFTVFPNPTRDVLNISYSLAQTSDLNITVIDMMGRRLSTVFNGTQAAGSHMNSINMNDASIGTGIYFLSMEVDGEVSYQKVSVLR